MAAAAWLLAWLASGLCPAQAAEQGIWPAAGSGLWYWIGPRSDLEPGEVDAALGRAIDEATAFVDPRFTATVFFAKRMLLAAGKSGKRKAYAERPEKADDLRIEAEWQTGYLNQHRGRSYVFIALDDIRGLDLHYLPVPRERFPKAPEGRSWNVNVLADRQLSFFFYREDTARAFINAVASALRQRGLALGFSRTGLMWENITPAQAADMRITAGEGVLVTMVAVGGPGDRAGVRPLDAVIEFGGARVKNFSHFSLLAGGLAPGAKAKLLLLRRRKDPRAHPAPADWETLAVEMEAR